MRSFLSRGVFICLVLLVSLSGGCLADSPPASIIYIQGGESIITAEPNGTSVITIQDTIPYYHMLIDNMSYLGPIQNLSEYSGPIQAAMVLSGDKNERISMVTVEQVSLSEDNKVLTLQVKPLEFYEGSGLKTFSGDREELVTQAGEKVLNTGLYLEIPESPSQNIGIQECIKSCTDRGNRLSVCWRMCERTPEPVYIF